MLQSINNKKYVMQRLPKDEHETKNVLLNMLTTKRIEIELPEFI